MADPKKRLANNAEGEFFVDSTCINCDTCRQLAPATFVESGDYSRVFRQPEGESEKRQATRALLACPTGSIGCTGENISQKVLDDFPLLIEDGVFYCGFNSPKSYGANSYFIQHPDGNWLVDSPKYQPHLVQKIEQYGGIAYVFLTHKDDVADSHSFVKHFGAKRVMHRSDFTQADATVDIMLEGQSPIALHPDFVIIPTPGHTKGHCVLLYRNKFLFTGDHLDWSREAKQLDVSEEYCWYSFAEQMKSMEKLEQYQFEWVLPGHGQRVKLSADEMQRQVRLLVAGFKSPTQLAIGD